MKRIKVMLLFSFIFLLMILVSFNDVIFQEEISIKLGVAIIKLNVTSDTMIEFDNDPNKRFVVKFNKEESQYNVSNKSYDVFINEKESEGWKFIEQIG